MSVINLGTDILSAEGVEHLSADSSPWKRAQIAATVALLFVKGELSESEQRFATGILDVLARDLELQVREALSNHVKHCALLPNSIAMQLAMDVDTVALPILRYSSVLTDEDLLEIVRTGGASKQIVVARRDDLPSVVSGALVDTHKKVVVGVLLENETAQIDETSYGTILQNFADDEKIQTLMAERPGLPAMIVARMIDHVGEVLRQRMIDRFGLPETLAEEMTSQARDIALTKSVGHLAAGETLDGLAQRLHKEGALTPVFLLRTLCNGQFRLFTTGMAARAGIPVGNADELIQDRGERGFMTLYLHADMPGDLLTAFRIALSVVHENADGKASAWSEADTRLIIARWVSTYDNLAPGHLESVLAQIARNRVNRIHAA